MRKIIRKKASSKLFMRDMTPSKTKIRFVKAKVIKQYKYINMYQIALKKTKLNSCRHMVVERFSKFLANALEIFVFKYLIR